jgi:hypothetical protein
MILYQSDTDNLIIERVGFRIECRYGRKVIDTMPSIMSDYADTRLARQWVIINRWNGDK